MDESRFDRLTAALGSTGSRRQVAVVLAALALPGVVALDHAAAGETQERRRDRRRKRKQDRRQDRRKGNVGSGRGGCAMLGPGCKYIGASQSFDCQGANLSGLVIPTDCLLLEANLSDANMTRTVMDGVDLQASAFQSSTMDSASLVGANLIMGLFQTTNLRNANLTNADLRFANLHLADLTNARLSGTQWMRTTCPDGSSSDDSATRNCCGHLNGAVVKDGC